MTDSEEGSKEVEKTVSIPEKEEEPEVKLKRGQHRTAFVFTEKRRANLEAANQKRKEKADAFIELQAQFEKVNNRLLEMEKKTQEGVVKIEKVPTKPPPPAQDSDEDSDEEAPPPPPVSVKSLTKPSKVSKPEREQEVVYEEEIEKPKKKKVRYVRVETDDESEEEAPPPPKLEKSAYTAPPRFNPALYGVVPQRGARSGCVF